jgi:hypothetical protein
MLQSRLAPAPLAPSINKKILMVTIIQEGKSKKEEKGKKKILYLRTMRLPRGLVCRLNTFVYLTSCRDLCPTTTAKDFHT